MPLPLMENDTNIVTYMYMYCTCVCGWLMIANIYYLFILY